MYKLSKRIMDLSISIFALIILSPVFAVCIIVLALTGEHKVWYLQERTGMMCKPFKIFKFATMLKNSPNIGTGDITLRKDPRVLPFGHFLRKTKINELPQILNVLFSSMSIVGPRPLTLKQFQFYSPETQKITGTVKPGITGIGSVIFRDEEKYTSKAKSPQTFYGEHISPYKGELETWYVARASFMLDVKLIALTALVILFPETGLPHKWLKDLPPKPEWMN